MSIKDILYVMQVSFESRNDLLDYSKWVHLENLYFDAINQKEKERPLTRQKITDPIANLKVWYFPLEIEPRKKRTKNQENYSKRIYIRKKIWNIKIQAKFISFFINFGERNGVSIAKDIDVKLILKRSFKFFGLVNLKVIFVLLGKLRVFFSKRALRKILPFRSYFFFSNSLLTF